MIRTIEAIVDSKGQVHLSEPVHLDNARRAIVTILEDAAPIGTESSLLSEAALAADWNRPEEDAAWARFQQKL